MGRSDTRQRKSNEALLLVSVRVIEADFSWGPRHRTSQ
jgi:hypothetical protein